MSDEDRVEDRPAQLHVQIRRSLIHMVGRCYEALTPLGRDVLGHDLLHTWHLTGAQEPVCRILERLELATQMDQAAGTVESRTYQAVMRDLVLLRALLGLERR